MDKESEKKRAEILSHLSQTKFIGHREPAFFHGYHYIMIKRRMYVLGRVEVKSCEDSPVWLDV